MREILISIEVYAVRVKSLFSPKQPVSGKLVMETYGFMHLCYIHQEDVTTKLNLTDCRIRKHYKAF